MRGALKYDEIVEALQAIVEPESVFELRLLGHRRKRVDGGYFNNIAEAATALVSLDDPYAGIYLTPNPVNPELLSRAANRIKPWVEWTTSDKDILRRTWLLIDIDPDRPSGISSTNLEHNRAIDKAREIAGMLDLEFGWCNPLIASSGNGAHLMYPVNESNTSEIKDTFRLVLQALASRFDAPGIKIDKTVFNAARIWRLPGTWARKGDSTIERPHRKATILQKASDFETVSLKQLQELVDMTPNEGVRSIGKSGPKAALEGEQLYSSLNEVAMQRIDQWVPAYFPGARAYKDGYRITSYELGRDREEDVSVQPYPVGIFDFGERDQDDPRLGKRTPVNLLADFHFGGDAKLSAHALASTLEVPVTEFGEIREPETSYANVFEAGKFKLDSIKSYSTIQNKVFKELKWIIPNVLPSGCFVLAARPKMRKSWLALQLCVASATGGKFLDWKVNKAASLFLGLEDNERRIKHRIETLHTFDMDIPKLDNLYCFTDTDFPKGEEGTEAIASWLDQHPDCRLVVIDTFAHFRKMSRERDIYLKDYMAVMPLTRLADERDICIIVVHHEKKGLAGTPSGDFIEDVSGSSGITGGVSGIISIKGRRGIQEENESRKLMITGRDVPNDYELDMSFDAERGGWLTAARQDAKTAIKQLFLQHPFMTQMDMIAMIPNMPANRIRRAVLEMKFEGELIQSKHGYSMRRE